MLDYEIGVAGRVQFQAGGGAGACERRLRDACAQVDEPSGRDVSQAGPRRSVDRRQMGMPHNRRS